MGSDFSFMIIRETSLSDLDQIVSFLRPQYENTYGYCDGLNEEVFRSDKFIEFLNDYIYEKLSNDESKIFIAVVDKQILGTIGYEFIDQELFIWGFYVDHNKQSFGIGRHLWDYLNLIDNVMNAKSKKLHVQKVADNVIDFYKRHGYCIVGERILTWTDFLDHEANIELWTMEN